LHLPAHAHASAFVLFVREGAFAEEHARRRERFDRFTCIYRPRLDEHANDFSEGGALLTAIDVHAAWLERLREAGFTDERFSVRSPFVRQFGDRLEAELSAPDAMSEMVIEALATEVIVFGTRRARAPQRPRRNACAERARRLIEADFAAPLSLTTIAAAVGVHPVHLAREFRAAHACTVGDYIRHVRVAYARHQLAATDEPIATIAVAAGFADQSQLTKTFKRVTGETPAAYRAVRR
jgi:AraC family transcriptional regulator